MRLALLAGVSPLLVLAFQNCGGPLSAKDISQLSASSEDSLRVVIAWDKSSSAEAVGYKIYYGSDPADLSQSLQVSDVTTATIDGLPADSPLYFTAVAVDAEGRESEPAPIVRAVN
jgi:hypothetical protein